VSAAPFKVISSAVAVDVDAVARRKELQAQPHLRQIGRRPDQPLLEQVIAEDLDRQADRHEASLDAHGGVGVALEAAPFLPEPAAEVAHRAGAGGDRLVLVDVASQPAALGGAAVGAVVERLERRDPAKGLAAHRQFHAHTMKARQVALAARVRHQFAERDAADEIDERAGIRVVAHAGTPARAVRVLHLAARHLDGLQRLHAVVEIDRAERQHQRMQRRWRLVGKLGVQQRELAGRMAQPRRDLREVLLQALGIAPVAALLLVDQHGQRERDGGQREQREGAAEEHAQPQGHAARKANLLENRSG
jgi:hypothetical protein